MLKTSFILELKKVIAKSNYFLENDFEIVSSFRSNIYSLSIKYIYEPQYNISLSIPDKRNEKYEEVKISGTVCPGEIGNQERVMIEGKRGITDLLNDWLLRIKEELFSEPLKRELENQKAQIEEIIRNLNKLDDGYFTKEEAEELKMKLSDLEKDLKKNIQEADQNEEIYKKKINALENDIEMLKTTLTSFKKKAWAKSFATRIGNWFKDSDNTKLLKNGIEIAKALLTDGK